MLSIDPSARPFRPIRVPALADLTRGLFEAYRAANDLEDEEITGRIAEFFQDVTPDSSKKELYHKAHQFNLSLGGISAEGVHHVNSFFHIVAVAQESRRQATRLQLKDNMWAALKERKESRVSYDEALLYGAYVPGGFAEWFFPHIDRNGQRREAIFGSLKTAIKIIERVIAEYIFTQHPTNSNLVELNRVIAGVVGATVGVMEPGGDQPGDIDFDHLKAMLQKLGNTQRIPDGNLTVNEEVSLSNNSNHNFMLGRADALVELIDIMKIKFGAAFTPKLQLRVAKAFRAKTGDWAGSDDDGNENVKAEHRLSKLSKQRLGMVRHYLQEHYQHLEKKGVGFSEKRVAQLKSMEKMLEAISDDINSDDHVKKNGDIVIPLAEIPIYSEAIARVCVSETGKSFAGFVAELQKEAEQAFLRTKDAESGELLLRLVNDLMNSGLHGYHNELRKNCTFNKEALGEILKRIPGLADRDIFGEKFDESERDAILNRLGIEEGQLQQGARDVLREAIPVFGTQREFADNPIIKSAHTIASLDIAQDHTDCYQNFVLAETTAATDYLVAADLQVASFKPRPGKMRHWLNIIGLFENEESLRNYAVIVLKALHFDIMKKLVVALKGRFQIMFAHSDSWRLTGRIAADGLLAVARLGKFGISQLENLPITWGRKTVKLMVEKFHGLSYSDPSRSGLRDQIGMIIDWITARLSKKTVQGVDQANFFNDRVSAGRMVEKDLTKAVKVMMERDRKTDNAKEMVVAEAAAGTATYYATDYFKGILNKFIRHPFSNYDIHNKITNFSSRLSSRIKSVANAWVKIPLLLSQEELNKSRAISVSNALFYRNIVNIFWGARHLETRLAQRTADNDNLMQEMTIDGQSPVTEDGLRLRPAAAKAWADASHEFTRNIDKIGQGLALTDYEIDDVRQEWGALQGIPVEEFSDEQRQFIYDEYCRAGSLVCRALTGKELPGADTAPSLERCMEVRDYIQKNVLPMEDRDYLDRIAVVPFALHDKMIADAINGAEANGEKEPPADIMKLLRELDNALNRVRGPRLDVSDIAESGVISSAERCPAPNFMKLAA